MLGWFLLFAIGVSWAIVCGAVSLLCMIFGAPDWAAWIWAGGQLLFAASLIPLAMAAFLGGSRHLFTLLGLRSLDSDVPRGRIAPADRGGRHPLFH